MTLQASLPQIRRRGQTRTRCLTRPCRPSREANPLQGLASSPLQSLVHGALIHRTGDGCEFTRHDGLHASPRMRLPPRPQPSGAPAQLQPHEIVYVAKLRRAYSAHSGKPIPDADAIAALRLPSKCVMHRGKCITQVVIYTSRRYSPAPASRLGRRFLCIELTPILIRGELARDPQHHFTI